MASNLARKVPKVSTIWPKFKSKSGLPEVEVKADGEKKLSKSAQKPLIEEQPPVEPTVRYRVCQHRKPNFAAVDRRLPTAEDLNIQSLQPAQHPKRLNESIQNRLRSFSNRFESSDVRNCLDDIQADSLLVEEHAGIRDGAGSKKKFVFEKTPVINLHQGGNPEPSQSAEDEEVRRIEVPTSQEKGYRAFDDSSTQKNVMPSHTMSDQEKADQAQAQCRVPRSISRRMTS
nr:unnamed protein product [Callosobruchus chinensis]